MEAGDATAAKAIFDAVIERETTEGRAALARAAEAARHKGTLAMLDDTLEALAAFRCAADLDPSDAWTWIHISRLEAQGGKLVAAEDAARRARQTAEAQGEERDVKVAMDELGDVLVGRGDLMEAQKSYRDAFAIAGRLADADPGNAQWQRDLAWSHWRLAKYGGDPKTHWGEVVRILKELDAEGRLAPVDQKWLPTAEENLAALKK